MVKNWKDIAPSGEPVVDAMATIIYARRKQNLPLKTLSLSFRCYQRFEDWMKRKLSENKTPFEKGQKFQFDGVDIEFSPLQEKDFIEEYYPIVPQMHVN